MTMFFVTAIRISDVGHIEECLVSDVVRNADGFSIDNTRPMAALDVINLISRGNQMVVWNNDGNGGSTNDEVVTVLPGPIQRLDSIPGHLIYRLPEL